MPPLEEQTNRFLNAWMQVRQIVQAANFNRFHRAGLSATQFMAMNLVPKEGTTLSDLSRRLNLSAATLNATVNSLEERGLLRRTRDARDARKVTISVTPEGEKIQNSASQEFHTFISGLFQRMSKSRRDGLLAGLEQMVVLSETGPERGPAQSRTTPHEDAAAPVRRNSRRSRPR